MVSPSFDPNYPEPRFVPDDAVAVVATGERTVVAFVVLVRMFGEPVAYAYLAGDGRTYGASEIRHLTAEEVACGSSAGRSSGSSSPQG